MEMSHSPVWVISHLCSSFPSWLSGKSLQTMVPPEYSSTSSMNFVTASLAFMEVTPPMTSSMGLSAADAVAPPASMATITMTRRADRILLFIFSFLSEVEFLNKAGYPHYSKV